MQAEPDTELKDRVPAAVARRFGVFPMEIDSRSNRLAVAMVDPADPETVERLRRAVGVSEVRSYLARYSTIVTAIERAYVSDGGERVPGHNTRELERGDTQVELIPGKVSLDPSLFREMEAISPAMAKDSRRSRTIPTPQVSSPRRVQVTKPAAKPAVNLVAKPAVDESVTHVRRIPTSTAPASAPAPLAALSSAVGVPAGPSVAPAAPAVPPPPSSVAPAGPAAVERRRDGGGGVTRRKDGSHPQMPELPPEVLKARASGAGVSKPSAAQPSAAQPSADQPSADQEPDVGSYAEDAAAHRGRDAHRATPREPRRRGRAGSCAGGGCGGLGGDARRAHRTRIGCRERVRVFDADYGPGGRAGGARGARGFYRCVPPWLGCGAAEGSGVGAHHRRRTGVFSGAT
ncbi:MAG: hypothetical protein JRH20_27600 [Deltaproteobacteria bacterium]|nr:hypothetical protein [Deltaproteobacteria bacterium]